MTDIIVNQLKDECDALRAERDEAREIVLRMETDCTNHQAAADRQVAAVRAKLDTLRAENERLRAVTQAAKRYRDCEAEFDFDEVACGEWGDALDAALAALSSEPPA